MSKYWAVVINPNEPLKVPSCRGFFISDSKEQAQKWQGEYFEKGEVEGVKVKHIGVRGPVDAKDMEEAEKKFREALWPSS